MARRGGPGGHGRPSGHGGHGRPGGRGGPSRHGGPSGYRRPRGRMPHSFSIFGYSGMRNIGWVIAPVIAILFTIMLVGEVIGTLTNFTTILGVLCIVGAFALLYQMRPEEKTKRKRSTDDDDGFYDEQIEENPASS